MTDWIDNCKHCFGIHLNLRHYASLIATNSQRSMTPSAIQQDLRFLDPHRAVAIHASYSALFTPKSDGVRFGIQVGEITLQQLLLLPDRERRHIAERRPYIDIYLGDTRVYKRTSQTMLFACCPDIGRFTEPVHGQFVIRLPQGFSNALSVKLAVLYMEQYLLNPLVRGAPWIVRDNFVTYIYLSELFEFIGMSVTARQLEIAITTGMRRHPLEAEQVVNLGSRKEAISFTIRRGDGRQHIHLHMPSQGRDVPHGV
jgi:hypothetical protein